MGGRFHAICAAGRASLYLAFISDVFSRMIVGWQLAANMRTTLVLDALRMALGLRAPGADFQLVAPLRCRSLKADSSGRRNPRSRRVAMGVREGGVRSDGAAGDAFAGEAAGVAREHRRGSGRRLRAGCRARRRRRGGRVGGRLASDGSGRVAGCRRSAIGAPLSGRYLSFAEREEIALLRAQGVGCGRSLAGWVVRRRLSLANCGGTLATRGGGLEYRATTAQWHADRRARRPKPAKLAVNAELRRYVQERLSGAVSGRTAALRRSARAVDRPASWPPPGPALGQGVEP